MAEPSKLDESQRITTDERGSWAYPSLAASGHVEVEVPSLPGNPRPTEQLLARDFGGHVAEAVERSLRGNPYSKSGPQQSPPQVFQHFVAVAKGAKLMDEGTLDYGGRLAREFDKAADQGAFFNQKIRPFLNGLKPGPRQK